MPEQPGAGRLDPETLAAYMDGLLPPEERAKVDAEIAADPETYEWMVNTLEAVDDDAIVGTGSQAAPVPVPSPVPIPSPTPRPPLPFHRRRTVQAVAGTLLAAAAALVMVVRTQPVWWQGLWGPAVDPRFAKLVEAVGEERYIEARLTGGFKYGPMRQVMRGPGDLSSQNLQLLAAAGELQKAAEKEPTAENLHAWGVAQVLLNRFDEGVGALERASSSTAVEVRIDLAAALLARAEGLDRPADLPRALDLLEAVIADGSSLPELWFNKATVLQALGLRAQAIEAWNEFLLRERDHTWRAEGQRRLATLKAQSRVWKPLLESVRQTAPDSQALRSVALEYPEELRDILAAEYLPRWFLARPGSAEQGRLRARALAAANLLHEGGRDELFVNAVRDLDRCLEAHCRTLDTIQVVEQLERGLLAIRSGQFTSAHEHLSAAVPRLGAVSPAFRGWASYNFARALYFIGQPTAALTAIETAIADGAKYQSSPLVGRTKLLRGLVSFTAGRWDEAGRDYRAALAELELGGERHSAASAHINLSILARFLGDQQGAWAHRRAAAVNVPQHDPDLLHGHLITGGITAALHGHDRAALVFQSAVLDNSAVRSSVARLEARLQRARMLERLGRQTEAESDLESAELILGTIEDQASKVRARVSWLEASAEISQATSPERAVARAREALAHTADRRDLLRDANLHFNLGRALVRLNRTAEAQDVLDRGLRAVDTAVASIDLHDPARPTALEPVWRLVSEATRLALANREFSRAFQVSERWRARAIRAVRGREVLSLEAAQNLLQSREAVLLFSISGNDCVAWTVTKRGASVHALNISPEEAQRAVAALQNEIASGVWSPHGKPGIFESQIGAILVRLDRADTIAVVGEGPFVNLVWPALRLSPGGLAGDTFRFVVAPSVSLALAARLGQQPRVQKVALINPALGRDVPQLPAAVAEVARLESFYVGATTLRASDAEPRATLALLSRSTMAHFAGHAVDVPAYPMMSHLLMSPGPDQERRRLFARDVSRTDLSRLSLVVLAACSTAGSRMTAGEGSVGMAWAFLAAGSLQVVANRWPVDDAAAARFAAAFHNALQTASSTSAALQAAQRVMRAALEPPVAWLGPMVLGAL